MNPWLRPDWPAPANVHALATTRQGGASIGSFASLNLARHVGDELQAVDANRKILRAVLPSEPLWLAQVHGCRCVSAEECTPGIEADACVAHDAGRVCAVMTADCLPVLLCDQEGTTVGAAHAGWRGLAAGVIEATVVAMRRPAPHLMAWLGPAIGPSAFEVGDDVRSVFVGADAKAERAFTACGDGKWLCDLYELARQRLAACGVPSVSGGRFCTYADADRFFSFRRDGKTGRMATVIWLQ